LKLRQVLCLWIIEPEDRIEEIVAVEVEGIVYDRMQKEPVTFKQEIAEEAFDLLECF